MLDSSPARQATVLVVDDVEGVALASRLLLDDGVPSVVGMDAEWKPRTEQGGADGWGQLADGMGPVSILQLATRTHVVLLDMLALLRPAAEPGVRVPSAPPAAPCRRHCPAWPLFSAGLLCALPASSISENLFRATF